MYTDRKRAVFLDLNGTLIDDSDGTVTLPVTTSSFYPGVMYALKKLQSAHKLFIITNQSSVGLGRVSKDDADKINNSVINVLNESGIRITELFACRHTRADACQCIKPNPYFLLKAQDIYGIDLASSFVIGDHPHDMELAHNAGCKGIYVFTGHGKKHLNEVYTSCLMFPFLQEAAEYICRNNS